MNLENIMLSERSQTQKAINRSIPFVEMASIQTKKTGGCQQLMGVTANVHGISF